MTKPIKLFFKIMKFAFDYQSKPPGMQEKHFQLRGKKGNNRALKAMMRCNK